MDSIKFVMSSIDSVKEKLSDSEYKDICNALMECRKKLPQDDLFQVQYLEYIVQEKRSDSTENADLYFELKVVPRTQIFRRADIFINKDGLTTSEWDDDDSESFIGETICLRHHVTGLVSYPTYRMKMYIDQDCDGSYNTFDELDVNSEEVNHSRTQVHIKVPQPILIGFAKHD